MTNTIKLEAGKSYDTDRLEFVGWTPADADTTGYECWAYFVGRTYLGPDQRGVEPLFRVKESVS